VLLQAVLPFERLVAHLAPVVDRWQMVAFVYEQRIVFVERPVAVLAHKLHFDPLGPESVVFRVELYYRVHGRAAAAFSPGAPRADYGNNILLTDVRRRRSLGPESRSSRRERVEKITRVGNNVHDYCNNIMTCSDFQIGVLQLYTPQTRAEIYNTGECNIMYNMYLFQAATADCGGGGEDDDDKTL